MKIPKKNVTVYCYQISIFCLDFNLKWLKDLNIQKFAVNENLWYKVFVFMFLAKPIDKTGLELGIWNWGCHLLHRMSSAGAS